MKKIETQEHMGLGGHRVLLRGQSHFLSLDLLSHTVEVWSERLTPAAISVLPKQTEPHLSVTWPPRCPLCDDIAENGKGSCCWLAANNINGGQKMHPRDAPSQSPQEWRRLTYWEDWRPSHWALAGL